MTTNLHILVLAAGASTRLGQPKQLVRWGEKTLLEKSCETAISIENQGITVVLGASCEVINPAIEHLPVRTVFNENWALGMGTTIACGIASLPPDADAVLLLLCDQPFVSLGLLKDLVEKWQQHPSHIVASAYGGSYGPPAIFGKECFDGLLALQGQQGAKKLMGQYTNKLLLVDFPEGLFDIDTPADLGRLPPETFET
ncbi:MAG: nucleotidyltransferase family protein [Saprospiraceae bacterium]|nr:nucleotidyltransferase family protein [Saprospiraceae bacterium]